MKLSMADVTDPAFAELLSSFQGDQGTCAMGYNVGFPALSLHDDVVYITNRLQPLGRRVWVVAIDTRHQTMHDAGYLCSGRPFGCHYKFLQSGHLDMSCSW